MKSEHFQNQQILLEKGKPIALHLKKSEQFQNLKILVEKGEPIALRFDEK